MTTINELVGKDLASFKVLEMVEVYRVDTDGRKTVSLGFFENPDVANAFAGNQTDSNWVKTKKAFVLTNEVVGFVIAEKELVRFFDDEQEALNARTVAVGKLSPAERRLLGFE